MSGAGVNTPLLDTIEPDEPLDVPQPQPKATAHKPVVLTPANRAAEQYASTSSDAEAGISGILRQSAHPIALMFLYFFKIAAIAMYILGGYFNNYVLSTVIVVVLLSMDFWNCRNVSGRVLVGLRYWNQVDEDGESYWVFESRDPSRPANPIDSKMFWIALYAFPVLWVGLLIIAIVKLNLDSVPTTILALIFNTTNVIGFTYADRDAKEKWASGVAWNMGFGGIGGQLLTGAVKNSVGRVFGSR
jgi:hypothetical protein